MNRIQNRKVVIIGGTSGIGWATAQQLSSAGAKVTVAGREEARAAELQKEHPELAAAAVDASSAVALKKFYQQHGPIDDLVLTVSGAKGAGPFAELDLSDLMTGFQEKFFAQVRSAQLALPNLAQDASITFVSAISARAANPATSGLAAINGALESMIKPLARELKPIRVNAVSPGVVETSWWNKVPERLREQMLRQSSDASLVGRNGKPEDLADAICLLVRNSFITGTVLEVDGGLHLN